MNCIRPSSFPKLTRLAALVATSVLLYAAALGTAFANAGVGLAANFPPSATIGATGLAANLDFTNVSTPTTLTISINSIDLTPSCAAYTGASCTTPDNGIFQVSPTGTGRVGTACAGVNFTFTPKVGATDGTLDVLPSTPISLGVPGAPNRGDECVIDFTFDVLKAPDTDGATDPLHPGLQTLPSGIVNGTASDFSTAEGFGTTFITVLQPVGIATTAAAGGAVGTALTDQATLTLGTAPTGSIVFNLYAPADVTCTGTPIFASSAAVSGDGIYTSGSFTPTTVGDYRWRAFYSGDANNAPVAGACNDVGESSTITQAAPAIATTASTGGVVGTALADQATLSGGASLTGSVTFDLYGPDDATCANTPVFASTTAVSGAGTYASGTFTPAVAGTYRWRAFYSGDVNNIPVAGLCNDAGESAVITQATPALVTAATPAAAVGSAISDTATLSGGHLPTGILTFNLYAPGDTTCSSAPVFTSTVAVNGVGNYPSGPFIALAPGTYLWRAAYSGDVNNSPVAGSCNDTGETTTVTRAAPAIATAATTGGTFGTALSDQATLSGGANPTGTITFNLYGPGDATCSSTPAFSSTVAAAGDGNYGSGPFTPTAVGTYRWTATYSGDANNLPTADACNAPNETATITQVTPTIATTASTGGAIGTALSDTATLAGGNNPGGTITFNLYGPNDATCTNAATFSSTVAVSGDGSYPSGSFQTTLAGVYRWRASYSGDVNNAPAAGACNATGESATINMTTPAIATSASTGGAIGTSVSDAATLSGGSNPTGTILFTLYAPSDATCTNTPVFSSSATVSGNGTYPSGAFTSAVAGTYRWRAAYSGDANNAAVSDACNAAGETVAITQTTPTIATTASAAVKLGGSVTDTAVLSAGTNPTGSITFRAYGPNDASCSTLAFTSSAITVSGNGSYTSAPAYTPAAVGTYRWIASYSGDANNIAVAGACGATGESVVVNQATPAIVTTASTGGSLGAALGDHATLSGGTNPTGTITFSLYGPNDATCSTTAVSTSSATVSGNGSYASASFTPTLVGTYRWRAVYSGDAGNASVSGACNDAGESATISTVTPTLATTASAAVKLGGSVTDTAALAGGSSPTGTITFRLYGPNDASCTALVFTSGAVTVSGNGNYTSAPTYTPTSIGTYRWIASYSGDASNASVVGTCGAAGESVVVNQATPAIVTTASAGGALGAALSDQATLSAGNSPTGTITFTLYGPDDASCGGTPVFTSAATTTVSGNGNYASASFTPTIAGAYRWRAAYGGDTNNAAIAGACNDANETATITGSSPTISTQTSASILLGASIHDTATLAGGTSPTGSIAFSLYGPNDATCSRAAIFTTQATVNGNGSYVSPSFTPVSVGTYRWIAAYGGDTNNLALSASCNDANENAVVSTPPVQDVPTLTQAMLVLLSLLLGTMACAGFGVRRR